MFSPQCFTAAPAGTQGDGLLTRFISYITDQIEIGSSQYLQMAEAHAGHFEGASS